jgi:hypothetical protein
LRKNPDVSYCRRMTQEISEPRLKRIGRALLRGEAWASEDADRAGLALDEVIDRARAAVAPKPKQPVGRSKRDLLAIINEHYEPQPYGPAKPVPIKSLNHLFLMVEAMKVLHAKPGKRGARPKKLTDFEAYERFVVAIGEPTKPFGDEKSDIPINATHLKNLRYRMACDLRIATGGTVTIREVKRWRRPRRFAAYSRLVAGLDPECGVDEVHRSRADRALRRSA